MPAVRIESYFPDGEVISDTWRVSRRDLRRALKSFHNIFSEVNAGSFELVLVQQKHKYTGALRWVPCFSACPKGYRVGFRTDVDGGVTAAYLEAAD